MELEQLEKRGTRTILRFAIPSILAMVLTALVNVVDGYFVGNYVGEQGLAAVNLGLPIVYLYLAVGLTIAVGGVSIAGRLLGAAQPQRANAVFRQTVALCALVTAALSLLMAPALGPIARALGANAATQAHFTAYYGILLWELPLMVLISALGMFLRGQGDPGAVLAANLFTVALNALLDHLFVCPLGLGTAGVAAASVCAAGLVLLGTVLYFFWRRGVFGFGRFRFCAATLRETLLNGSSEGIGELSMCLSMGAYNYAVLQTAGVDGLAAFTIIGYVSYLFSMVVVGFGQGLVPIASFAYGARREPLALYARAATMRLVTGTALAVFAVLGLCGGWYSSLFTRSSAVTALVTQGLRLQMSAFAFAGINSIASFYFTAIGRARESAVISSARGLVVLLPALALLPWVLGISGVWLASLTTETVTLALTLHYLRREA